MMVDGTADLAASYDRYFAVIRASTPELLDRAYRLRYLVYCVENQFEDPALHLDGREIDSDDDRSVHTLLVHRQSSATAGAARLILPLDYRDRQLPICRILSHSNGARGLRHFPPDRTAEVSRFAVSKEFRRRHGEQRYPDLGSSGALAYSHHRERRLMPFVTFGLLRGILGICLDYGITHLAAVMEPALVRILVRFGLDFEPIGSLVEHHGMRQPCVARLADLMQRSRDGAGMLWQYAGPETAEATQQPPPSPVATRSGSDRRA